MEEIAPVTHGVNVMIIIFGDFHQFSAKIGIFLNDLCNDNFVCLKS
jgi:hypothetical protein